jgi:uncharacterized protein YqeY
MTIKERIDADYTREAKARNQDAVSTLRMLMAELKNEAIDKRRDLTEDEIVGIVQREIKKLKDSIDSFQSGGRQDLESKAQAEVEYLKQYLPEQLDDSALAELVESKISELSASSPKDIGRVMGEVMKEAKGRAEGAKVSALVKERLSGDQ